MLASELLKDGKVVYIDLYPQSRSFFDFLKGDAVGGENDILRVEPCKQSQFNLLNRHGVQPGTQTIHKFEDGYVR